MDYKQVGKRTLAQINADNARAHGRETNDAYPSPFKEKLGEYRKTAIYRDENGDLRTLDWALSAKTLGELQKKIDTKIAEFKITGRDAATAVPGSINLSSAVLRRRNMAIEWAQEHAGDYPNAQQLAQAASTKYDVQVDLILSNLTRDSQNEEIIAEIYYVREAESAGHQEPYVVVVYHGNGKWERLGNFESKNSAESAAKSAGAVRIKFIQ